MRSTPNQASMTFRFVASVARFVRQRRACNSTVSLLGALRRGTNVTRTFWPKSACSSSLGQSERFAKIQTASSCIDVSRPITKDTAKDTTLSIFGWDRPAAVRPRHDSKVGGESGSLAGILGIEDWNVLEIAIDHHKKTTIGQVRDVRYAVSIAKRRSQAFEFGSFVVDSSVSNASSNTPNEHTDAAEVSVWEMRWRFVRKIPSGHDMYGKIRECRLFDLTGRWWRRQCVPVKISSSNLRRLDNLVAESALGCVRWETRSSNCFVRSSKPKAAC